MENVLGTDVLVPSVDGVIRTENVVTGEKTENGTAVTEFTPRETSAVIAKLVEDSDIQAKLAKEGLKFSTIVLPTAADLDRVAYEQEIAESTVGPAVTRDEFQTEIIALRAEIEHLQDIITSFGKLVEGHAADIEAFQNRIAAFNQRSTHKL